MRNAAVDAVIAYWDAHDVPCLAGVGDAEMVAFENEHDVKLPEDVRAFYRATNGTRVPLYNGADHEMYEFYRLSDLEHDYEFDWAMNFADYSMVSWWFAIDLTGRGGHGTGTVYMMGSGRGRPLIVAHSLTEFLDLYVRSDDRLWPSGAQAHHESVGGDAPLNR